MDVTEVVLMMCNSGRRASGRQAHWVGVLVVARSRRLLSLNDGYSYDSMLQPRCALTVKNLSLTFWIRLVYPCVFYAHRSVKAMKTSNKHACTT
jgi:hypothetical protein